jgi:peptide deformylase
MKFTITYYDGTLKQQTVEAENIEAAITQFRWDNSDYIIFKVELIPFIVL